MAGPGGVHSAGPDNGRRGLSQRDSRLGPCRHRRRAVAGRRRAARVLVGHRQLAGHRAGKRAVQHAVPRRRLRRLHRDDRELGVLAELYGRGTFPGLLGYRQHAGAHRLRHLPHGRQVRGVLVQGGPGVDPNYNGSTTEASAWGARQAARALSDIANGGGIDYPVVWIDVEVPGIAPAPDNGWNSVYTSPCSGVVRQSYVSTAVDRADFNGFAAYIAAHSSYKVGVYSSPGVWTSIFGTGTDSLIPDTYEWTYEPETASLGNAPYGWCLKSGGCAQFFGGQTSSSSYALMWQWSGGGGIRNGVGDFDQIDAVRQG